MLGSLTCTPAHTCIRTCRLVQPAPPQAHVSYHVQTCTHTCLSALSQTHWCEHMYAHLQSSQCPPDMCRPSGTEGHPTGPTCRAMKQTGSPGLCASPRPVSTTVRATYSCWCDTGSHCVPRLRGTMRACFLQLPTTSPGSRGPWSPAACPRGLGKLPRGHVLQEDFLGNPRLRDEM